MYPTKDEILEEELKIKYENKISTISDGNEFLLYFKDYFRYYANNKIC